MRTLLLDIGNTRLKWGVFDGSDICETGDIPQADITAGGLAVLTSRLPLDIDHALASNVAGAGFGSRLKAVLELHCKCEVRYAHVEKQAFGLTNAYDEPRTMGVDRWVAMLGAWRELGAACLVVDAGTAVTIDAIDDTGLHLGGQILPGLALMQAALANATSDIPLVEPEPLPVAGQLFGTTTETAVGRGSLNAVAGAIERAARVLRQRGLEPDIILTGGDASRILPAIDDPVLHKPHLVLTGLLSMLEDGS